ncbi:MAG: Rpn family recombination-promoting nuclease/putative transposase [Butyrivibrio sp.]|nr:Rpn family recombination-promoting nuclease/putative transposase [Muribaculum sp.]MCM1553282.1 Rpn family recombination-promoting nuclease/putative transposase [Butyrivibrio sp.]
MESTKESKDLVEKNFMAFPDIAADVINALLYEGTKVVQAESLLPASTETLYSGGGEGKLRNQYEDLAKYEMQDGRVSVVYLFANQSTVDYRMVLRGAGYVGGVYREQYEGKHPDVAPVIEIVLYWGTGQWNAARDLHQMFRRKKISSEVWQYVDDIKLRVWEMRHLPPEIRELFNSDMRIVLDYLAEGESYRSDRPVVHKEALVKMLRVLSGDGDVTDTEKILQEMDIREEDEITMCELFDQYIRKGRTEGLAQGHREGREEGIRIFILDNMEEGKSSETIVEKLCRRFSLDMGSAQAYYNTYGARV